MHSSDSPYHLEGISDDTYDALRHVARKHVGAGRSSPVDVSTLVQEAAARLGGKPGREWPTRGHFLKYADTTMLRILSEEKRKRGALKRGGHLTFVPLHPDLARPREPKIAEVSELLEILELLENARRLAFVILDLRIQGYSISETAEVLNIDSRSIETELAYAKAFVRARLDRAEGGAGHGA